MYKQTIMARSIQDLTNVNAPSGVNPYGTIKDDTGSNNGTPVNEAAYGDKHVFFDRLMAKANIAFNGHPDNETNTFQLFEAFVAYTNRFVTTSATSVTISGSATPTFVVREELNYRPGMMVRIQSASSANNYMYGRVVNYVLNGSNWELTITVIQAGASASGTHTDWTIYPAVFEPATQAQVDAGTDINLYVTPATLAASDTIVKDEDALGTKVKVIDIGTWDMDADATKDVAHGVTNTKIRAIDVMIVSDGGAYAPLMQFDGTNMAGGIDTIGALEVTLRRRNSGTFDSTNYNGAGNRGFVTIHYVE